MCFFEYVHIALGTTKVCLYYIYFYYLTCNYKELQRNISNVILSFRNKNTFCCMSSKFSKYVYICFHELSSYSIYYFIHYISWLYSILSLGYSIIYVTKFTLLHILVFSNFQNYKQISLPVNSCVHL